MLETAWPQGCTEYEVFKLEVVDLAPLEEVYLVDKLAEMQGGVPPSLPSLICLVLDDARLF